MLGDDLRGWFELFHGIVIYRPKEGGGHDSDGWLSWKDIEDRFKRERLKFDGKPYDALSESERSRLLDSIASYGRIFVMFRLLEKRRQTWPPALDYRVTRLGRRVGNWGYGPKPGLRKKAFFLLAAIWLRAAKFGRMLRWPITVGAIGWATLNAWKFYAAAWDWASSGSFAAWSALVASMLVAVYAVVKGRLGGG